MTNKGEATSSVVDECNCNALRKASRRVSQFYDSRMKPSGLRITQYTLMVMIWEAGGISVNDLAHRMGWTARRLERTFALSNAMASSR